MDANEHAGENNDRAPNEEQASNGSKVRVIVIIAGIAVLAATAGYAAATFPAMETTDIAAAAGTEPTPELPQDLMEAAEPVILDLDPIVVNIANTEGHRYLKATLALEVRNVQVKEALESRIKKVQLMDLLNSILSGKSIEAMDGQERRDDLRREIRDEANLRLDLNSGVARVYLTEFVIQ